MSPEPVTHTTHSKSTVEKLALMLTLVVNPLILPPLVVYAILDAYGQPLKSTLSAVGVVTLCFAVIPFIVMIGIVAKNNNVTIELRDRKYRTLPFLIGIGANVGAVLYFSAWHSQLQPLIFILMIVYLINNVALLLINLRFKISLHMASISGATSILFFMLYGVKPIPLHDNGLLMVLAATCALMIPILWWARRTLDAHTKRELTWGTLFGILLPPIELYVLSPLFA